MLEVTCESQIGKTEVGIHFFECNIILQGVEFMVITWHKTVYKTSKIN